MKKLCSLLFVLLALMAPVGVFAQTNANLTAVEIPNLAYFGVTALGAYVHMQGNATPGDGGDSYFYRNGLTCTVDGQNTIKDKSGNCFFRLQKTPSVISPLMFGAKCDNSTNDAVALQATEDAAAALHASIIYPAINQQGLSRICRTLTTLVPRSGVDHFCQAGMNSGDSGAYVSPYQCGVTYNGVGTGWVWEMNNPNGIEQIQAPTWHDMYMTSTGGCIKLNDPAHGFTDDPTSQQFMLYPRADRVTCVANTIGLYCGKCFYGTFEDGVWSAGSTPGVAVRFQGTDISTIRHNNFLSASSLPIDIIGVGTFGNNDVVSENFIACPTNDATGLGCIRTSARSTYILSNSIECSGSTAAMAGAIRIVSPALTTIIDNNTLSCTNTQVLGGLSVETDSPFIRFTENIILGTVYPSARFNSGTGIALFPSSIQTQLVHYGNSNEGGFPFTSEPGFPEVGGQGAGTLFSTWPGNQTYNVNISGSAYAPSVRVKNGAYQLPAAGGGGNVLNFNAVPSAFIGTLDICIKASSPTAAQQVILVTNDGGAPVSSTTFNLTANPTWYCKKAVAYAAGATFAVVNSDVGHNGTVELYRGVITQP